VTRRNALTVLLTVASWLDARAFPWRRGHPGGASAAPPDTRRNSSAPAGALSQREMESILAYAEVLVEGRTLAPAERKHLIEHIEHQTRNSPGALLLYQLAAGLLDRVALVHFSTLDLRKRAAIVASHRLVPDAVRREDSLLPSERQVSAVRAFVVPDLIAGYYASPAGWAAVGYRAFPGRCSNLIRYTRAER
jgi:hypothetical protein